MWIFSRPIHKQHLLNQQQNQKSWMVLIKPEKWTLSQVHDCLMDSGRKLFQVQQQTLDSNMKKNNSTCNNNSSIWSDWGKCVNINQLSKTASKVTTFEPFMTICETVSLQKIGAIVATNEGISAGILRGSMVLLLNGKVNLVTSEDT